MKNDIGRQMERLATGDLKDVFSGIGSMTTRFLTEQRGEVEEGYANYGRTVGGFGVWWRLDFYPTGHVRCRATLEYIPLNLRLEKFNRRGLGDMVAVVSNTYAPSLDMAVGHARDTARVAVAMAEFYDAEYAGCVKDIAGRLEGVVPDGDKDNVYVKLAEQALADEMRFWLSRISRIDDKDFTTSRGCRKFIVVDHRPDQECQLAVGVDAYKAYVNQPVRTMNTLFSSWAEDGLDKTMEVYRRERLIMSLEDL